MSYQQAGAVQMYRAGLPQFDALVNPATISGVKEWWKASSIAQADSSAVTTWTGTIAGIAPTQATAGNKPTYRTTQGPNSTPAVSFDGGDHLAVGSVLGSALWSTNQGHAFIVLKQTGSDAQNAPFTWFDSGTNMIDTLATYDNVIYFDSGNRSAGQGRVSVAQPVGWDDAWQLLQLIRIAPDSGTQQIRVNGAELVSAAVTRAVTITNNGTVYIGSTEGPAIQFTGLITDILIYNVALGTTDRQNVEAYLNSLYALF